MNRETQPDISVIIPAAGRGRRMGHLSKALLKIKGMPVLLHTLNKFKNIPGIKEIIIALDPTDIRRVRRLLKETKLASKLRLVRGGARRQDSVFNALKILAPESRYVIIHDAARPLIKRTDIIRLIRATKRYGATVLAVLTTDTIKRVNPITRRIKYTLSPREEFWLVQTPQGFKKAILIAAYKRARARRLMATDDASLVETLGYPVKVIPGSYDNIKITTPADKIICQALLTLSLHLPHP